MSVSASYASEAQFGPPSEPVSIQEFLNSCSHLQFISDDPSETPSPRESQTIENHWSTLTPDRQRELAAECRRVSYLCFMTLLSLNMIR